MMCPIINADFVYLSVKCEYEELQPAKWFLHWISLILVQWRPSWPSRPFCARRSWRWFHGCAWPCHMSIHDGSVCKFDARVAELLAVAFWEQLTSGHRAQFQRFWCRGKKGNIFHQNLWYVTFCPKNATFTVLFRFPLSINSHVKMSLYVWKKFLNSSCIAIGHSLAKVLELRRTKALPDSYSDCNWPKVLQGVKLQQCPPLRRFIVGKAVHNQIGVHYLLEPQPYVFDVLLVRC